MTNQPTLTTGEAAKLCQVSQRTVIRWIDSGRLNGFRHPGAGGHRRVLVADVFHFLKENGLPIPPALEGRPLRALVVEDEAIVALLIEETLHCAGFETRIAPNGFEAGQALGTFDPDVVTLDLKMPGIPGIEVLEAIRRDEGDKHIAILVVSGMPKNELEEALAKGADQVLAKPFRNEELLQCIQQIVGEPPLEFGTNVR